MTYFEFEVKLGDATRTFLLNADLSFDDLHAAIQDACGWMDLEEFRFPGAPENLRDSKETIEYRYGELAPAVRRTKTVELPETFERRLVGGAGDMPSELDDDEPDPFDFEILSKVFNYPLEYGKWSDDELLEWVLEDEMPERAGMEEIVRRERLKPRLEEILDDDEAWDEHASAVLHATFAYAMMGPDPQRMLRVVQRGRREGWPEISDAAPGLLARLDRPFRDEIANSKTEAKDLRKLAAQAEPMDLLAIYDLEDEPLEEPEEEEHVHGPECAHTDEPAPPPIRNEAAPVGRNDPCPCGSGKKFKKCCGK